MKNLIKRNKIEKCLKYAYIQENLFGLFKLPDQTSKSLNGKTKHSSDFLKF